MARRLGALVVVGAVGVGVLSGVRAVIGGGAGEEEIAGEPSSSAAGTDATSSPVTAPSIGAPVVPTSSEPGSSEVTSPPSPVDEPTPTEPPVTDSPVTDAPVTEPDGTGPPTVDDPARIYIAGDSDAGTFGPYLSELLADVPVVEIELDYKVSSGLSRPDYFDWPARFAQQIPSYDPDIVVVTFGGNDAQGLADESGEFIVGGPVDDEEDWREEYGRRAGEAMDRLSGDGRTLIWVGIPNDNNPEVTARMQVQDEVVKAQAAERPQVVFIDTWQRFSGRSGGWAEYVVDPRDGIGKDVRAGDGFHLNETGAEILALDIARAVRADLRARGA